VRLGSGDDQFYLGGQDEVDCGPGFDTVHVNANQGVPARPVALRPTDIVPGAKTLGCEQAIGDAPFQLPAAPDLTAGWTNAGQRAGAGAGAARGSLDPTTQAPFAIRLTNHRDVFAGLGGLAGTVVLGRDGDDDITGTQVADHLEGELGNDTLSGRGGDDHLFGRIGNDKLFGDAGDDELQGGRGRDVLSGGPGNDTLTGGFDADTMDGGPGRDRLVAVDGSRDRVDCGAGRDDTAIVDRRDSVRNCEHVQRGSKA
jgi:Ca2+-binding RTX toxin-like protein